MQILSPGFLKRIAVPAIDIRHSFLRPSSVPTP
jgi:formyltetrahydrofolate hydrolase